MGIDRLREDAARASSISFTVEVVPAGIYDDQEVSVDTPAGYWGGGVIRVLDQLSDENRIEAEAHELAHVLLRAKGLLAFDPRCQERPIVDALNNGLSHKWVREVLDTYCISNDLHDRIRIESLDRYPAKVAECGEDVLKLQALGLGLWDDFRTLIPHRKRIAELAELDRRTKEAFDCALSLAGRYFAAPYPQMWSFEEQYDFVRGLFEGLGFRPVLLLTLGA